MSAVEVLRIGMVTGVGLNAAAACAAIRAGIAAFEETRFMFDGEWLLGCEVPLEEPWRGRERLLRMVVPAIQECLEGLGGTRPADVPLFLGLAEETRPGRLDGLDDSLIADIERRLDVRFHPWSRVFANGRIGAVQALDYTRRVLAERVPFCVVAGRGHVARRAVPRRLLRAASAAHGRQLGRVHPGRRRGRGPDRSGRVRGDAPLHGLGYGLEPAPRGSGQPTRADGLVQAFQSALADASWDLGRADYRIADLSGEQYGFKEAALAMTRVLRTRKEAFYIWHPADCVGETGAAAPLMMLAVACAAAEKEYAPGPRAIAHVAADGAERAAFLIEASSSVA